MNYYTVAELQITDKRWVQAYAMQVTKMVERRGGRYLTRTSKAVRIEGGRPTPHVFLVIEWPSREVADEFYRSDEYRPFLESRLAGSSGDLTLIAGVDDAGQAQMPG